jgi:phage FluMu gp28-like protein
VEHFGSWIEPVMMSEPWYRENMPALKAAFEDATIEIPRDREIMDDFRALKLVRGVARVPLPTKADDGKRRHGDAAIAGVLAIAASRAEPEMYGYEPARRHDPERDRQQAWQGRGDTWEEDNRTPARTIMPDLRGGMFR